MSIDKDLKLKLNTESAGSVYDPGPLETKLASTFQERTANHSYDPSMVDRTDLPEEQRIAKSVFVKAPRSMKYGEVVKVIDAIKGTGANPIGLQVDDLAE